MSNNTESTYEKMTSWRAEIEKKLRSLLLLRLVMLVLISGAIFIFLRQYTILYRLFAIYAVATLGYLTALYFGWIGKKRISFTFLYSLELFVEIIIESAIVYYTGRAASPLTLFYLLSIMSSAFVFELPGTVITATTAAITYIAVIYLSYAVPALNPAHKEMFYANREKAFAIAYIQVCFLYIVAFLAGFLSRRIKSHFRDLSIAKEELVRAAWGTDQILAHIRSGLISIDEYGTIVYFNNAASRILQLSDSIVSGRNFATIFPERLTALTAQIALALKTQGTRKSEIEVSDRSNNRIPLSIVTSALRIPDAEAKEHFAGVIALFDDVTEEKRRDAIIQQTEKMAAIGELSARLAHELRNPLATIRGGVEMLSSDYSKFVPNNRLTPLVLKESDRITQILENFLVFARLKELPREQFRVEIVDLSALILSLIEMRTTISKTPTIHITHNLPANLKIIGNRDQLVHVFQNLFDNAIEAIGTNSNGEITVTLLGTRKALISDEQLVGISISDNGCGIPEDALNKIFEPFYTRKPKGTGLGLSIVQGIITQLGGFIEVSNVPNGGARFDVFLPLPS